MTKFPFLQTRWVNLLARYGVPAGKATQAFKLVETHYAEAHRSYHTLGWHITPMLTEFDQVKSGADNPDAIELGIFLHDVIYDVVLKSRNEERSVDFGIKLLRCARVRDDRLETALTNGILATRHDGSGNDYDSMLLVDLDLSGFSKGSPLESTRRIRFEYDQVPYQEFVEGHGKILRGFLNRPLFYNTAAFNDRNNLARENVAVILERLPELAQHPLGPGQFA